MMGQALIVCRCFFLLMIRRPPRSTLDRSSAASDVYKRQVQTWPDWDPLGGLGAEDISDAAVEVDDVAGARTLVIEKSGSRSTVVWNPWIEKVKRLADLPDGDYPRFLCIEPTNAR